ncbi:hypothetical protein PIROE2DRAFT_3776 [Piromyces sp. E2]|nr:hypothetical protein PIROE2DRAFT_3776 [Piromyces sp. E2]|eukprot:OUM68486.1 hypothetical protein PIROE2DRAFT_3776 [Piromyces sp. E2]
MFYKNLYINTAILSLLYVFVYCDNNVDFTYSQYNVEEVKKIYIVDSCNTVADCPSPAIGCGKETERDSLHCIYPEYACSGKNKCYSLNTSKNYNYFMDDDENTTYTALDANNKEKKIIAKSCNTSKDFDRNYDGKIDTCSTAKCNSNDECLSNKCVSGICLINKTSPTYHCKVSGPYYSCNQLLDEHCVSDSGCASFKCHESDYICVKEFPPEKEESSPSSSSYTIYIIIGLVVLILIILTLLCCFKFKKNSGKTKNSNFISSV